VPDNMKNHLLYLLICSYLAASCSTSPETVDENHLKKGDSVRLEQSFAIPDLYTHVIFQDGEIIKEGSIHPYKTSCIADTNSLGPKTIEQNDFKVSKISYFEDIYSDLGATIRYYTEIHLDAADSKKNITLTCQVLDGTMQHHSFPLSEIKQATGQYFTFSSTDNK
jgi:hypothetical protein